MQPDYVKMELSVQEKHETMKKILPAMFRYRFYYQPAKMQVHNDQLGDFEGIRVELPFSEKELAQIPKNWMKEYLIYIAGHLGVENTAFFIAPQLADHFAMQEAAYDVELRLMLLKDMADILFRKYRLLKAQADIMIIDDGTWHLQVAVRQLIQGINHLTIVTDRAETLKDFSEELLSEYGLAVTWRDSKQSEVLRADMCINLIVEPEHLTTRITGRCVMIDFGYTEKKAVKLSQINPNLAVYHTVKLKSVQDTVNPVDMSRIMYYKEPLFRKFVAGGFESNGISELRCLWDRYFVEMVRVY